MKLKYRNITVPYRVNNNKTPYMYYIYNDKEYTEVSYFINIKDNDGL